MIKNENTRIAEQKLMFYICPKYSVINMIKSPVQSLSALKAQDIKEYLLEFISDVEGSISIEMLEQ